MSHPTAEGPYWSTSSYSDNAETTPGELSALGEHLQVCQGLSGRLFALRCRAEAAQGFVAGRVVTTLAVGAVVIGLVLIVL